MGSFKAQLEKDIVNVFMNANEFADAHNIDDQQINCVLDDNTLTQLKTEDGVYDNVSVLYVSTSALPDRPVPRQHMRIDGDLRLVLKCVENMGLLEVTLEAHEA